MSENGRSRGGGCKKTYIYIYICIRQCGFPNQPWTEVVTFRTKASTLPVGFGLTRYIKHIDIQNGRVSIPRMTSLLVHALVQ